MKPIYLRAGLLLAIMVQTVVVTDLHAQTTAGTRFWIGYSENIDLLFNGDPSFAIIAAADEAFSGTVSVPQTGLTVDFNSPGGVLEVPLPSAIWYAEVDQSPVNKGILVETDIPVDLSAIHYRAYFSDGSRVLPESILSDEYMVVAVDDANENGDSQVVIVATVDDTEVEITPSVLTTELSPGGIPFTVSLDAGQIYQIKAASNLSGTQIRSLNGTKIAIYSGASQAAIGCTGEDSHHWEQVLPRSLCGTEYPLVPYLGQGTNDFRIVAFDDDTELFLNCDSEVVLDAGESYVVSLNSPALLQASTEIMVAQLAYSSDCNPGDSGSSFSILHPLARRSTGLGFRFSNEEGLPGTYFDSHHVTLVRSTSDGSELTLNGDEVLFESFPENPLLEFTQVSSDAGNQEVETLGTFWAYAASFGPFDACTYALGFDTLVTESTGPELFVAGPPISDELCAGVPVDFSYLFNGQLANPFWDFGDGSSGLAEDAPTYIYNEAGTYTVTFTANDGGCPVEGTLEVEILDCGTGVDGYLQNTPALNAVGHNLFQISGLSGHLIQWALFDLSGRQLTGGDLNASPLLIDLNTMPGGIYLLRATDGQSLLSEKVNLSSR